MKRPLVILMLLAGCARDGRFEPVCEAQVNSDPEVRSLIMRGAGSEHFMLENQDRLRQAKQRAALACFRRRGVIPDAGGVEAPKPP